MAEAERKVLAPTWPESSPTWTANELSDRGVRYADKFHMCNGWIYKAVGDLQPQFGILAVPDWAPASVALSPDYETRQGMVKVRDHRWPDGIRAARNFDFAYVPLYGRMYEIITATDILSAIVPEHAASQLKQNSTPVGRLCRMLIDEVGLSPNAVGVNGSIACGLEAPDSDIDLDIYGVDAITAVSDFVKRELDAGSSRWSRRWPPDRQTNLYYIWQSSYADVPEQEMYRGFEMSGRNLFNFMFESRRVSISYHSHLRDDPMPAGPVVGGNAGPVAKVTARFVKPRALSHFNLPATFLVADVRLDDEPAHDVALVVSDSKAFGYCRDDDVVRFVARPVRTDVGLVLIIPSYGPDWPVRPFPLAQEQAMSRRRTTPRRG